MSDEEIRAQERLRQMEAVKAARRAGQNGSFFVPQNQEQRNAQFQGQVARAAMEPRRYPVASPGTGASPYYPAGQRGSPPAASSRFIVSLVLVLLLFSLPRLLQGLLGFPLQWFGLPAPASFALIVWFGWPAFAGASIAYLISLGATYGIGGIGGTVIAFAALAAALQLLKPANRGMVIRLILVAVLIRLGLNLALDAERGFAVTNAFGPSVVNAAVTLAIAAALVLLLTPWLRRTRWVDAPAPPPI